MKINILIIMCTVLISQIGCRKEQGGTEKKTVSIRINAADNKTNLVVSEGSAIQLALPANPTTGYTWKIICLDTGVVYRSGESKFTAATELAGAPGIEQFDFAAWKKGATELVIGYKQWFDEQKKNDSLFSISITVQ